MADMSILEKVRALRALARSSNVHEAAAAMAQAARLVALHQIHEAELEALGGSVEERAAVAVDPLFTWPRVVAWQLDLAAVFSRQYGCAYYAERRRNPSETRLRIVGRPSDVELVRYFVAWLSAELLRLVQVSGAKGQRARSSWLRGAAAGIGHKLRTVQAEASVAARSSALVVLDQRRADSEQCVDSLTGGRGRSITGGKIDELAMRAGFTRGQQINLQTNALPGGRRALP